MNPSKKEKSSRRSSILKLPKARNPSEYGDQAVPVEESPLKANKRVSFSRKRHFKEFCDSNEHWDNTYEESDSSQIKTSQTSITDITLPLNTTVENSLIQDLENLGTNQHLQEIAGASNYHLDESNDTMLILANSLKRQSTKQNRLGLSNNDLNYFIDKENIPIATEPEKIESSLIENEIIQASHKIVDRVENISPAFSIYCDEEQDKNLKYSNDNNISENDNTVIEEQSMDCTLTADKLQISTDDCNQNSSPLILQNEEKKNIVDEINEPKEISSIIFNKKNIGNKTHYFEQGGMEMTEALTSILDKQKNIDEQNRMSMTRAIPSLLHNQPVENQTQYFQQGGMEITGAIPSLLNKQQEIHNDYQTQNRMSMTTAIPSVLHHQTTKNKHKQTNRQSMMEMTEAIPSVLNQQKAVDEKSRVINQNRMSMTTAIPSVLHHQGTKNKLKQTNRQSIMEMTEAIPSILNQQKITDKESQVINQNRMSMTTAIPSLLHNQPVEDRTQYFQQGGMEITGAIPSLLHQQINPHEQSRMEMTTAIPSLLNKQQEIHNDYQTQNRMSMTTAIPSVLHYQTTKNKHKQNNRQSMMEMTEAIPSVLNQQKAADEESRVINQNRMSMTTAIPSILHKQTIIGNEIHGIDQNNMEFTEAIPSSLNEKTITDSQFQNRVSVINSTISASPSRVTVEIINNNLEKDLESNLSLKRNYTTIRSPYHSRNIELSSPNPKLQISESSFVKTPSKEDRDALHKVLYQNLTEADILGPISKKSSNVSIELTTTKTVSSELIPPENSIGQVSANKSSDMDNSLKETQPVSTFLNSTIISNLENNQLITNNPIEDINISKISNKSIDEIIPVIQQTEISSGSDFSNSLKENYESVGHDLMHNSVVRELFEPGAGLKSIDVNSVNIQGLKPSSKSVDSQIHLANTSDCITGVFPTPVFIINDQQTQTIPVGNTLENRDNSPTIHGIQQSLIDNIDAIEKPSFLFNSAESFEVSSVYAKEIAANIKVSEKKIIQQIKNDREKIIPDNLEYCIANENQQNHNVINNETNVAAETQEEISINDDNSPENIQENSDIENSTSDRTRKRSILNSPKNMMTFEINKRFKSTRCEKSQSSSAESIHLDPEEPVKIIDKLYLKEKILEEKVLLNQIKTIDSINLKIKKNDLYLKKLLTNLENKKQEMKNWEEKLKKIEATDKIAAKKSIVCEENDESPFGILSRCIKTYATKPECIWQVKSIDPSKIIIEYYKTALWLVIGFDVPEDFDGIEKIKGVKIIPRLNPKESASLRITDRLIIERINVEYLKNNYKTYDHVMGLIKHVDDEINSIYNFYLELGKLESKNLMEITLDKITFVSRTKKMKIILRVSINVKPFATITPDDITVDCLLGNIKPTDVQNLIKNIKKNHKFLSFYVDDVRNFIELMEAAQRPKNIK